jgi:hypothetical protein
MAADDCPAFRLLFTFMSFLLSQIFLHCDATTGDGLLLVEDGDGALPSFEAALYFHFRFSFLRFRVKHA